MSDQQPEVAIAELRGYQRAQSEQIDVVRQEVARVEGVAAGAHTRIDSEIDQLRADLTRETRGLREAVADLREWRSKLLGVGVGITFVSGLLSGGVVALLQSAG